MSKVSERPYILMPSTEEDRAITAAAKNDPDAQPLTAKKLRELRHLSRFKESVDWWPEGNLVHKDRPDFTIEARSGRIGIEHTELLKVDSQRGSSLKAQESLWTVVTEMVIGNLAKEGVPFVDVHIARHPHWPLQKARRSELAKDLCRLISEHVPLVNERSYLRSRFRDRVDLPKEIISIRIARFGQLSKHHCHFSLAGFMPELTEAEIRAVVSEKETRISSYQESCSEVWLLIVVDGGAPSSFFDIPNSIADIKLSTAFDRVFIFEYFSGKSWEVGIAGT
jgi:hypothetical protein